MINYDASIENLPTAYIPVSCLGNYRGYSNENYYCTSRPGRKTVTEKQNWTPLLLKTNGRWQDVCAASKVRIAHSSKTRLFVLYSQNYAARHYRFSLISPKNPYSNQATQKNTCQIFVPKKIPKSKISNPKKSFGHPCHLKSRVPPLGNTCTSIFLNWQMINSVL